MLYQYLENKLLGMDNGPEREKLLYQMIKYSSFYAGYKTGFIHSITT
jgi:hypothetical protein